MQEHTIVSTGEMPVRERPRFLDPVIVPSTEAAAAKGETLALIRPRNVRFGYEKKRPQQIEKERKAYASVARQGSFFDKPLKELEPCPYEFRFAYESEDGKPHGNVCDDWETAAMFYNLRRRYGEAQALQMMETAFNDAYARKGMAFALGTHSRYPATWLLVGVIRLDKPAQLTLPLYQLPLTLTREEEVV